MTENANATADDDKTADEDTEKEVSNALPTGDLIHPDCLNPAQEFENRLAELVMDGEDAGLSIEEMHERMVKVHEDFV